MFFLSHIILSPDTFLAGAKEKKSLVFSTTGLHFPPDSADRARLRGVAELLHLDPLHVLHVVVDHLRESKGSASSGEGH